MNFLDKNGAPVFDLAELEPYHSFVEIKNIRHPIVRVEYGFDRVSIEWTEPDVWDTDWEDD